MHTEIWNSAYCRGQHRSKLHILETAHVDFNLNKCNSFQRREGGTSAGLKKKEWFFSWVITNPIPVLLSCSSSPSCPLSPRWFLLHACCLWAIQARGCLLLDRSHTAMQPKEDILVMASWQATDELPVKMYIPLEVMQDLRVLWAAVSWPNPMFSWELSKLNEPYAFLRSTFFHSPKDCSSFVPLYCFFY